jgi:hypothetical protein
MRPFVSKRMKTIDPTKLQEAIWKKIPINAKEAVEKVFSSNPKEALDALKGLDAVNPKSFLHLFRRLARSPDPHIAVNAIGLIGMYGERKDLSFINRLMYSHVPKIRNYAIMTMAYCNEPESLGYLKERLKRADIGTRKTCVKAISYLKPRDYELYSELSEHPKFRDSSKRVVRAGQIKDGSTTILLGGELYDKAIIRGGTHKIFVRGKTEFILQGLKQEAVNAWKKAFEFDWKSKGLDYNPIEPILKKNGKYRVYKNRDGTFRVTAGVIQGTSLQMFFKKSVKENKGNWAIAREIKRQKEIIDSSLKDLGITHSHDHEANYVVEMVKGKPRLHIIDFDAAIIEKK